VYVVCGYEYVTSTTDDKYYIAGTRGEFKLFDNHLTLGSQFITENREEYFYNLLGVDSIWQPNPNTRLQAEWAHSKKTKSRLESNAFRVEASKGLFKDKLKVQAYYSQIGKEFSNPVNVSETGTEKYGTTGELKITKNLSLIADHWMSRSLLNNIYDRRTTQDLIFKNDTLFLSTGYAFDEAIDEEGTIDDIRRHEINLKGAYKFSDNFIASTAYSWQRERDGKKFRKKIDKISPRLDVKLDENTSLYGRHDYSFERVRGTDTNLINHVSGIGLMRQKDSKRSYVEYGFVGGKLDSTTSGTEEDIPINDKVTLTTHSNQVVSKDKNEENIGYTSTVELSKDLYVGGSIQRIKTTGETDYKETAASVTADYTKDTSKVASKLEARNTKTRRERTLEVASKLNISDATYLLAEGEYYINQNRQSLSDSREKKRLMAGLGHRPIDNDRLNLLAKYEYEEDLDNVSLSKSDYISHIGSIEGIYDFTPQWELFFKYALKSATEEASSITTHSVTDLKTGKLTYDINPYIDVAGVYRILQNYKTDTIKQGAAAEVGLTLFDHIRAAAGYNFLDYSDEEYPGQNYEGRGPYIQLTYKFMDEAERLLESREEMLKRFADESAIELYRISQIPGDEKFVEEVRTLYAQAMQWYKYGKYEESLECLEQGMETYYAAKRYMGDTKAREEEFLFLLDEAEKLYEYGLKDKAFRALEKAYEINAYDKKLLNFMSKVRDDLREERMRQREILAMKRDGLESIAKLQDGTKLVSEIVKLHLKVGKEFYSIGDYEKAMLEWKDGITIATWANENYHSMKEERKMCLDELNSIYTMALLHWRREEYAQSRQELEKGLKLIGRILK